MFTRSCSRSCFGEQVRAQQGAFLGRLFVAEQQDTAHRAGQSGHHEAEPRGPHRGVQLRAPEAGVAIDHGPQSSRRNNAAFGCRRRVNRPSCPGRPDSGPPGDRSYHYYGKKILQFPGFRASRSDSKSKKYVVKFKKEEHGSGKRPRK